MNPDEQVWNMVKNKRVGRQAIKTKSQLKCSVQSALRSLQEETELVKSFFKLPSTEYAQSAMKVSG
ncbi:MAG: hypothetical protein K9L82_10605 [Chromatiaceae bacterium]|nr:hypothetical protein [Chromatiaceae bacterium]MCF7993530.1 hypothetical protein [Chromatiaceae bacterium]MCF8005099.1 hypothetical protein [Chromatiaceae bacterium]MCF8014533.1 hypothetical protein [Chromatiaceae bacterium]